MLTGLNVRADARPALLTALALAVSTCAIGSAPAAVAAADRAEAYTFAFQDAEIGQVVEEVLGAALGLTFTTEPGLTGRMSFRIDQKLTKAQLLEAFEAALAAHDVVLVRDGQGVLVTPRAKAKSSAGLRPASEGVGRAGYEVVAVPLSFATPTEVAKAFGALGPSDMVLYADDKLGLLVLGGAGRELEAALQTLKVLDRSGLESSKIRWFEMAQASAATVAQELDRILKASGVNGTSVVPLKRLNGVLVLSRTTEAIDVAAEWIVKLDAPARDEAFSLWVYRPRNTSAEALGRTLNSVLSGVVSTGEASGAASTGAGGSPATASSQSSLSFATGEDAVRVGVDKESNTLLISAPAARWMQLQKILEEIDRPPSQVLIEASILEVTLSDEFRFGVDWSVLGAGGRLKVTSTADKGGAVAATLPGLAITFIDDDFKAAVDALGARTAVEVVSAPKIMALDNRTAKLQIGDQVPVAAQSSQSTADPDAPILVTTEYRDTGVILDVTPRITGDDKIQLVVAQEVSSVAKTTTSGIDSPTIQQRKFDSTLMLRDGGAVALGGLISSTRDRGDVGVPFLKDVPGVGALFKTDTRNLRRTELIVLLRASIIRDSGSEERVMSDLLADMKEIQVRGLLAP